MRDLAADSPPPAIAGRPNAAVVALLWAFLFILPFRSSVALRNVTLWGAVALLVVFAWRSGALRQLLPPARLLVPVAALAAWCFASIAWSVVPGASAQEVRPEVITPVAAFLAFHAATRDARALDRWAIALATGLAVLALVAFAQQVVEGAWNPHEWHVDVGYYSTHAALALPLVAWAWLRYPSRAVRAALAGVAIGTLVVIYWTDNRIVWPGLALMASFAALLAARHADPAARRRLAMLAAAAVGAAALVFVAAQQQRNATLARSDAHANADFATDPRLKIWPQAIARWSEAPWLGRGFGRPALALATGTPGDGIQDPRVWHAHNVFLDVALELGLVGVALFLIVLGTLAIEAWRALSSAPPRRWVAIVALTTLLAFLVKNFPDDFFIRHIALLCAALAGAFTGALRRD